MGNQASQNMQYGQALENDISVSWEKLAPETSFPARDGHTAASVGRKLYVFGGVMRTANSENVESDELLVYDLDSKTWSVADVKGQSPAARSAATMCAVRKKLFLFGGLNQCSGWLDDLYSFDTETYTWSKIEAAGTGPSPRDKLASVSIGNEIYYFGGFGPKEEEIEEVDELDDDDEVVEEAETESQEGANFGWFDDLYVFNTETNTWSNPVHKNLGAPTPRAAHGMCAVGKRLVIFGGRDSESRRNDLTLFNTESRKWEPPSSIRGRQPEPRSFHTITAVGSRVVVQGGRSRDNKHFNDFSLFDTETQEWLQPQVSGTAPQGRGCHSATVVDDKLVIYGGSADFDNETMQCTEYFGDIYSVKTADIIKGKSLPKPTEEDQENIPATSNVPQQSAEGPQKTNVPATQEPMEAVPSS